MGLLQSLTIKWIVDLSGVVPGTQQLKGLISDVAEACGSATTALQGMSGAFSGASMVEELAEASTGLSSLSDVSTGTSEALQGVGVASEVMGEEVSSNAAGAGAALADLGAQAEATGAQVAQSGAQSSGGFSSIFSMGSQLAGTLYTIKSLGQGAVSLAQSLLGPAEQAENTSEAFTNLLGSSTKASAEIQQLNTFAAKTQFNTADIDEDGESLVGFGVKASNVIPDLTALGDALSAVGRGTPAELQETVGIIGKISTQGKITQEDITQLGAHGINALQAIALGAGKSTSEIQKMIADGTLPANQAIADLTTGIEKNPMLSGGMQKQSANLSGIMSTLTSNFNQFLAKIVSPALPTLESDFGKLSTALSSPSFQNFAKIAGTNIVGALKSLGTGFDNVVQAGTGIVNFFQNNQTAMNGLTAVLLSVAGGIVGAVVPAMVAWGISMIPVAIETLLTIGPYILVGAVVAGVIFGIIEAVQNWQQIMSALGSFFGFIGGKIGDFFSLLGTKAHDVVGGVGAAFGSLGDKIHGVWNGVVSVVKGAINGIIWDINQFIGFIDSVQIHIPAIGVGPVQTPAFNWNGLGIPDIPYLSTGGFVAPGTWAIAGDPGPSSELVYGGRAGATVFSHGQSQAILGGGGGKSGDTHVHIYLDSQEIAHYTANESGDVIVKRLTGHGPVRSTG